MEIAVVDDEKTIREHICALIEEQQPESCIEAYATGEESSRRKSRSGRAAGIPTALIP